MADVLAGQPQPLSWQKLLGGGLSDLAGKYQFVLVQPKQDFGVAGARRRGDGGDARGDRAARLRASPARRGCASPARWRWPTRNSPPSPRARSWGLIGSVLLISLWLFLAVRSWRLIVPILMTLGLGLMLTAAVRRRSRSAR